MRDAVEIIIKGGSKSTSIAIHHRLREILQAEGGMVTWDEPDPGFTADQLSHLVATPAEPGRYFIRHIAMPPGWGISNIMADLTAKVTRAGHPTDYWPPSIPPHVGRYMEETDDRPQPFFQPLVMGWNPGEFGGAAPLPFPPGLVAEIEAMGSIDAHDCPDDITAPYEREPLWPWFLCALIGGIIGIAIFYAALSASGKI